MWLYVTAKPIIKSKLMLNELIGNKRHYFKIYFIIGAIVCFYWIVNFIWLEQNTYPSVPDEPTHLVISLKLQFPSPYLNNVKDFFRFLMRSSGHWPPFFHISSALFNLFFGTSYISSVMVNIVYLLVLLCSVYFIGLKLFDKNTGILAVAFISLYPMVFRYSRFFGPDFALTAMVCLSASLLFYAEGFKYRKFTFFC